VAIITSATARLLWPVGSAVGQTMRVSPGRDMPDKRITVVGVVSDAHTGLLWDFDDWGQIYFPATTADLASREMPALVRTLADSPDLSASLARLAQETDADLPLQMVRLDESFATQLVPYRYAAVVAAGIGTLGLVLAVIGLYGIVSFAVTQRRRDIAVHVAMGASPADVLRLVLRRELRSAIGGLVAGLVISAGVAKVLASIAIPLAPLGTAGFVALPILLLIVTFVAAAVPAAAALRIAPMQVLRQE
jgi:ABC-type lipoprotein release transport system permease subunit